MTSNRDLLEAVEAWIDPAFVGLGFGVVGHEESESFDNATVTLQSTNLRVRIQRERGVIHIAFGSVVAPAVWFDSPEVMELLGLSSSQGLQGRDKEVVLAGLGAFVVPLWNELNDAFSQDAFDRTRSRLLEVRRAASTAR